MPGIRDVPSYTRRRRTLTDEEVAEHYSKSRCSETTGMAAGCCAATVIAISRRLGVEIQPRGRAGRALYAFNPVHGHSKLTMEQVCDLYSKEGLSGPEIARRAGISHAAVYACLRKFNIPMRQSVAELIRSGKKVSKARNQERKEAGKSNLILPTAIERLRGKV
jgi:hypothetical protein